MSHDHATEPAEHRPNACCDFHRHVADGCCHCEQVTADGFAEVWDEGYRSGFSNAMRRMSDEPNAPTTPNPYRTIPLTATDGATDE